jgi:hypothetical protein
MEEDRVPQQVPQEAGDGLRASVLDHVDHGDSDAFHINDVLLLRLRRSHGHTEKHLRTA